MTAPPPAAGCISAALLLARWWSRPTDEEVDGWSALWSAAYETTSALGLDGENVAMLEVALEESQRETLLDEYERLLVGPGRPPCAPYESLWRADLSASEQGTLMGPAADAVALLYRDLGLEVCTANGHELPDHLLGEWEALAYALEHGVAGTADELLRGHLDRWMAPFCHAVAVETDQPFYATLSTLTPAWTAALVT